MSNSKRNTHRNRQSGNRIFKALELLSPKQYALVSEAAVQEGQTLNEFVRTAALDAAEAAVELDSKIQRFQDYLNACFNLDSIEMEPVVVALGKALEDVEREEQAGVRGNKTRKEREEFLRRPSVKKERGVLVHDFARKGNSPTGGAA